MDIHQIHSGLEQADFQQRIAAISALKDYPADIAVPILISKLHDPEFLVRTFVCRELGKQQTAASFAALLEIIKFDNTPNVRAEAANALSLFGKCSASQLVTTFIKDEHWLVRRSILAALIDLEFQREVWEVCQVALNGDDFAVREAAIQALGTISEPDLQILALDRLLTLGTEESFRIRMQVAYALKNFKLPAATAALAKLRQDSHHQVVSAALESLI